MANPVIVEGRINGIDVSSAQGVIDFREVKRAGFEFVYVQCTRYSSQTDGPWLRNWCGALDAGLVVGFYHFCSHDTDPVKQIERFFRVSGGFGSASGQLPPMLDWEYCTPSKYPDHPRHCVSWINNAANTATRLWYPDNHLRRNARRPTIYTYPNYAALHQPVLADNFPELDYYPLTYASYKSGANGIGIAWLPSVSQGVIHSVPRPWTEATLWQYSGNGGMKVPGVKTDCDRLLYMGSREEWKRFIGDE